MSDLDVLITHSTDTPAEYFDQALASVNDAVCACPYSVNVIIVPGVPGNVGEAMMNGLKLSTAEYVAWVDDDDTVLLRAFAVLAPGLAKKPVAVCARETRVYANGHQRLWLGRHHLTAFKSSWVKTKDLSVFKATPLVYLITHLPANVIDVMDHVYLRRVRRSSAQRLRKLHTRTELASWQ